MANIRLRSKRFEKGRETREAVLGPKHIEDVEKNSTALDEPFQELITEGAWGYVWSRDHWSKRERSMVTIALLAALGHYEECKMHVNAAHNTGLSQEDICEAMLHVALYAGIPSANSAIKAIKEAFKTIDPDSHEKS